MARIPVALLVLLALLAFACTNGPPLEPTLALEQQSEPPCDDCSMDGGSPWSDSFGPREPGFHCDEADPNCHLRFPSADELARIRNLFGRMSGWARDFLEGRILTGTLKIWTWRFVDGEGRTRIADLHHRGAWDPAARLHLWSGGLDDPATLLDTLCHEAAHFRSGTADEEDPAWQNAYVECMRP